MSVNSSTAPSGTPNFQSLKTRQRALRGGWSQGFGLRVHRAISWIRRAESETADNDAAFLFLWIAFNAAYGGDRSELGARYEFEAFFHKLGQLDKAGRLYQIVWSKFPGPIRLFLENRYVFAPFWNHHHGAADAADWEHRFDLARRRFHWALTKRETATILSMLFDRLYILRNQMMHGGATWNSATNRGQLRDGTAILESVVPVMVDLMMDAPEEDWGVPMYPVVEA